MTRMRFCDRKGRLDFSSKGDMENVPKGFRPWFDFLHPGWADWTLCVRPLVDARPVSE